jgi:hypothetical protein
MSRLVDPKRTRKAQRAVRALAEAPVETLSDWEKAFLEALDGRLETYGSAFADLSKGAPDEALSRLQTVKLKEIAAKARGKQRKPLQARKPLKAKRAKHV